MNPEILLDAAQKGDRDAQFRLGARYFSRGIPGDADIWLRRAAEQGHAEALNLLGVIYLNGIGVPPAPVRSMEYFTAAARQDLKEAHFNLAGLLFSGVVVDADEARAIKHLLRAAELRHRPALRTLGYLYACDTDNRQSQELATWCFSRAALLGDAHAEYALGMRHYHGQGTAVNREEGLHWIVRAATKNMYCANAFIDAHMAGTGEEIRRRLHSYSPLTTTTSAPEARDLPPPDISTPAASPESRLDPVSEYPHILQGHVCDYLINLAAPRLQRSEVVDPATGKALRVMLRTSSSMNFELSMYDMVVGLACRRLASAAGTTCSHAEPMSILRYLPGEEYKPHYDYFALNEQGVPVVRDKNGQRISTVFAYLNDVEEGGETVFPRLATTVAPAKGKAVRFGNCDPGGQPNPDTLHAGLPVIRGEKWLATLWFRERPFDWSG
ncbi:MAG: SEL1-like repeat protein [Gammaproteobacteria bacterium]|nr:SEL1-like repeat protein [Gammaproteobacteria bacterium]